MADGVLAKIRRSYGLKLVIGFLLVLVAIGAIGGYTYTKTTHQLNRDAEQQLETRANDHATALDTWLNNSRSTARLVSNSAAAEADNRSLEEYLSKLVANGDLTKGARAVHYVNASTSEVVASSLDDRVGANPRSEGAPWAQRNLADLDENDVLVATFQPAVANTTVVTFVSPVSGVDDRAIVYVADVRGIGGILRQSSKTAYTRVIDSQGRIVYSQHDRNEIGQQYTKDSQGVASHAVATALDGTAGYERLSPEQTPKGEGERVVGYAPTTTADWAVVVHEDPKTVFSLERDISTGLLALLAATVIGLGAIGLTLGRSTLDSIDTLATKARRMEDGDLDVDLETDRSDEIGDLFAAFLSGTPGLSGTAVLGDGNIVHILDVVTL